MNEYQGYTLTDITINSNMSLTGKIYYGAEFKRYLNASDPYSLITKFHDYVDDNLKQQSELTNFANELVELCKKYEVELSSYAALKVNDRNLCWTNRDFVHGIYISEIVRELVKYKSRQPVLVEVVK